MTQEIERKFILKQSVMDEFLTYPQDSIESYYLNHVPELRIQKRVYNNGNVAYKMTIKSSGDLIRTEIEKPLEKMEFEALAVMSRCQIFKKYVPDFHGMQVSIAHNSFGQRLFYGEVEFSSKEEATNYVIPGFVEQEITNDSRYKMKNFAANGLEK